MDAVGSSDMGLGTVFSEIHEYHEEPILKSKFWGSTKVGQTLFEHGDHENEGLLRDTCEPFEVFRCVVLDIFVEHTSTMA